MNLLEICNRIKRKCRITGAAMTSVSTTQAEEFARVVDWANEAWMLLQRKRPDWKWMRNSMYFTTTAGQATYTLAQITAIDATFTNFGNWARDTFRCYTTSVGTNDEVEITWLPYDQWRDVYQIGANRATETRPTQFTITPALGIGLGCTPAAGYTISGDYYKVATEMAATDDTPSLPSQFHMAIVYRAMMLYGVSESAPEIYDEGAANFKAIMQEIEAQQLTEIGIAGALA